jgi:hypothetical protein
MSPTGLGMKYPPSACQFHSNARCSTQASRPLKIGCEFFCLTPLKYFVFQHATALLLIYLRVKLYILITDFGSTNATEPEAYWVCVSCVLITVAHPSHHHQSQTHSPLSLISHLCENSSTSTVLQFE